MKKKKTFNANKIRVSGASFGKFRCEKGSLPVCVPHVVSFTHQNNLAHVANPNTRTRAREGGRLSDFFQFEDHPRCLR